MDGHNIHIQLPLTWFNFYSTCSPFNLTGTSIIKLHHLRDIFIRSFYVAKSSVLKIGLRGATQYPQVKSIQLNRPCLTPLTSHATWLSQTELSLTDSISLLLSFPSLLSLPSLSSPPSHPVPTITTSTTSFLAASPPLPKTHMPVPLLHHPNLTPTSTRAQPRPPSTLVSSYYTIPTRPLLHPLSCRGSSTSLSFSSLSF